MVYPNHHSGFETSEQLISPWPRPILNRAGSVMSVAAIHIHSTSGRPLQAMSVSAKRAYQQGRVLHVGYKPFEIQDFASPNLSFSPMTGTLLSHGGPSSTPIPGVAMVELRQQAFREGVKRLLAAFSVRRSAPWLARAARHLAVRQNASTIRTVTPIPSKPEFALPSSRNFLRRPSICNFAFVLRHCLAPNSQLWAQCGA